MQTDESYENFIMSRLGGLIEFNDSLKKQIKMFEEKIHSCASKEILELLQTIELLKDKQLKANYVRVYKQGFKDGMK